MKRGKSGVFGLLVAVIVTLALGLFSTMVYAQQASSTNYSVDQAFFGNGGDLNACSTSYCTKQAAGETTVGNVSSTSYQAQAGFNTNRDEYLEINVTSSNTNFGVITPGTPTTTTGTFSVKSYLSNGYVVTNGSDPPQSNGNFITNLLTPTSSNSSAEQFGINLVANTLPVTYGANPVQSPSGSFSSGAAAANYNTTNKYMYVKGDVIATTAGVSSGTTIYTVSYLLNTTTKTTAGHYTFNHILIATGTY